MKKGSGALPLSWSMWVQWGIATIILVLSIRFLVHTLTKVDWHQIHALILGNDLHRMLSAFTLTVVNYAVATGYDFITANQMKLKIGHLRLAIISLISFTFNNNLGLGAVTGALMRYRFFSRLKISTVAIGKYMILFSWVYWLGLLVLATFIFLFWNHGWSLALPIQGVRLQTTWIGTVSLSILIIFFGLVVYKCRCRKPHPILYPVGTLQVAAAQVMVSTLDWLLLSWVFYLMLPPHGLHYLDYIPVFLLAQIAAVMSHAPAGVGAFDSVIIYYLKPIFGLNTLVSSLLLFRFVYFLVPFIGGATLWIIYEVMVNRRPKSHRNFGIACQEGADGRNNKKRDSVSCWQGDPTFVKPHSRQ